MGLHASGGEWLSGWAAWRKDCWESLRLSMPSLSTQCQHDPRRNVGINLPGAISDFANWAMPSTNWSTSCQALSVWSVIGAACWDIISFKYTLTLGRLHMVISEGCGEFNGNRGAGPAGHHVPLVASATASRP